jgi:Skp family chaperone for outer membrane proteins
MKNVALLFSLLFVLLAKAQQQSTDTLKTVDLPQFIAEAKRDPEYEKRYQKLVRDVKRVLPYAKVAGFRFQLM